MWCSENVVGNICSWEMKKSSPKAVNEELLTTVLKNGCLRHSRTVIRLSGSTTRHLRIKSLGSSKKSKEKFLNREAEVGRELTGNILPLRWHEAVFSFHDVSQHYHLFAMPKRWATDEESEHDDTARPTKRNHINSSRHHDSYCHSHVNLFRVTGRVVEHVTFKRFRRQITWRAT